MTVALYLSFIPCLPSVFFLRQGADYTQHSLKSLHQPYLNAEHCRWETYQMQNLTALMQGHNLIIRVSKCHALAFYSRSLVGGTSKNFLLLSSVASSPSRP